VGRAAPAALAALDAPGLLERAVAYTRGCLLLVTPAVLSAPSPCAGWDVLALLRHLDDSLAAFTEAAELGYVDPVAVRAPDAQALVAGLQLRACALLGAWARRPTARPVSVAGHRVGSDLLAVTGAVEIAVHGWDVARGCGADRPIPAPLAGRLLEVLPLVVTQDDRPTRFASPVAVPPGAPAGHRLLAALGRRPG
jgi:uncharacterized protein (TIGR03086 family)